MTTKEEEYQAILPRMRQLNPDLYNNPARLRAEMEEMERLMNEEEDPAAKNIYAQARNILACALGEPLIDEPDPCADVQEISFVDRMKKPDKLKNLVLVDDREDQVRGMLEFLDDWPRMKIHSLVGIPKGDANDLAEQILALKPDLVLLDESIGSVKGTEVAFILKDKQCPAVLASISWGNEWDPPYTKFHLGDKPQVGRDPKVDENFVDFMNELIEQFGKQ